MYKKNILKHAPIDESMPDIVSAKNVLPDWYKNTHRFNNSNTNKIPVDLTFKLCPSFSDSLMSGYIIPLPLDIAIEQTEHGPSITWGDASLKILDLRQKGLNNLLPVPEGYSNLHFTWLIQHYIKIPKNYSALITHPLNRFDLPFITLSGVVDGEFAMYNGNIPVFFSNSFEGIIPSGTPIAQIIPFKTENWDSEKDLNIIKEAKKNEITSKRKAFGWYKNNIWKKKIYN